MGRKAKNKERFRKEATAKIASIFARYPRYELHIVYEHRTMDMSVSGGYSSGMIIPLSEIRKGEQLNVDALGCGPVMVVDIADERLVLKWEDVDYEVKLDTPVKTETYSVDNPYLSYEGVFLRFEYKYATPETVLWDTFDRIAKYHYRLDEEELASRQALVLGLLKEFCKHDSKWYVPLAVLSATDYWADITLERRYIFRNILLEGIEHGAISPEKELAWDWIRMIAMNSCEEFYDNKDLYIKLFNPAAEAGNEVARLIVDNLAAESNNQ